LASRSIALPAWKTNLTFESNRHRFIAMKKLLLLCLAATGGVVLPGCETTGDPNSGGIFWSESKAKQRIYARQDHLNEVESDTARVNRRNRRMENRLNQ
jgi:hypothetical protein